MNGANFMKTLQHYGKEKKKGKVQLLVRETQAGRTDVNSSNILNSKEFSSPLFREA